MANLKGNLVSNSVKSLGLERHEAEGLRHWLVREAYIPKIDQTSQQILLENMSVSQLAKYLGHDFCRFSLSSVESYFSAILERKQNQTVSWPLLKLYYSGFFSAHAILRSQGCGVIKLDRSQADYLSNFLNLTLGTTSHQVSPGMYTHKIEYAPGDGATLILAPQPSGQGVHEAFWKFFCSYLRERADLAVANKGIDYIDFSNGVVELNLAISGGASPSTAWIAQIRNGINYRHEHNVWYKIGTSAKFNKRLDNLKIVPSETVFLGADARKQPLDSFLNCLACLVMLNFEVSNALSNRSQKGGSFGQKWNQIRGTYGF